MIERILKKEIISKWNSGKVLIILGPRQVGKTTLIKKICETKGDYLFINGDDPETRQILENAGEQKLKQIIGKAQTVFIDEAQRINDIGLIAKIIHDQLKGVRLIMSGSSTLEIANNVNEPLTGRKWEYKMLPIAWEEFEKNTGYLNAKKQLPLRLIYGMYPEVLNNPHNQQEILRSLAGSYLYKDLLQYQGIRKPELLEKLLIALALQIGTEVNYNELSNSLRADRNTIETYIDLLEKTFVIFRLKPFSRNLRNELSTGRKIYFYDNGIRNALIGDFKTIELRNDKGVLWENFIISERFKRNEYSGWYGHSWYWRTYQQQEIDLIEEINGEFNIYEFKWNPKSKAKFSKTFIENYNPKKTIVITPENFDEFTKHKKNNI